MQLKWSAASGRTLSDGTDSAKDVVHRRSAVVAMQCRRQVQLRTAGSPNGWSDRSIVSVEVVHIGRVSLRWTSSNSDYSRTSSLYQYCKRFTTKDNNLKTWIPSIIARDQYGFVLN